MEECIICFHETDKFTYFPCTHKVCSLCFPKLPNQLCPLCETSFYEAKIVQTCQLDQTGQTELVQSVQSVHYTIQTDPDYLDGSFVALMQSSCCILVITIGVYTLITFTY